MRRVRDTDEHQDALLNIETPDGVTEEIIDTDTPIELEKGVQVMMKGIQQYFLKPEKYCKHCGRGDRFNRDTSLRRG